MRRIAWRQSWIEWGFLASMVAACAVLSLLQYRWTGEVSRAEGDRLRANLQTQLRQVSRAFDSELNESIYELVPTAREIDEKGRDQAHLAELDRWLRRGRRTAIFSRIAVAEPSGSDLNLYEIDREKRVVRPVEWPLQWLSLRDRLIARLQHNGRGSGTFQERNSLLIETPVFEAPDRDRMRMREREWMIFELNADYAGKVWLPDLIASYLNPGEDRHFDVEVRTASTPGAIMFSNNTGKSPIGTSADGSMELFSTPPFRFRRRGGPDFRDSPPNEPPPTGPPIRPGEHGRWILDARHRSGSVEALVASVRRRNLAVALALLGLVVIAGSALVRYTRRSRRLAEMQFNFVAGVSHELRTPLTVIRGAGHNLLSGVVRDSSQIDRYAKVIVQHAEQLTEIIEQVLAFAGTKANRQTSPAQPVSLHEVIDKALEATSTEIQAARCEVEVALPSDLPKVAGDPVALRRVFQNLISNAAKHGGEGGWIGITAETVMSQSNPMVEIRVSDRGRGIPEGELKHVFDAFYRGDRARSDQIRGTGLGLSLLKEIAEAHRGSVAVRSTPGQGTVFTVRLPSAAAKTYDEYAHSTG